MAKPGLAHAVILQWRAGWFNGQGIATCFQTQLKVIKSYGGRSNRSVDDLTGIFAMAILKNTSKLGHEDSMPRRSNLLPMFRETCLRL